MDLRKQISVRIDGNTARIFAGDYINKLSGERIERECVRRINEGCKNLIIDFSETEIVNSIGISILLGLINAAHNAGAKIIFAGINDHTGELFDTLGLSNHVTITR